MKKHPEQKKEMDKFMDYYMPTTLKLVNAYREFDALEVKRGEYHECDAGD